MKELNLSVCQTYRVSEISEILGISQKAGYNLCNKKPPFKVYTIGKSIRINRTSFDNWFNDK